MMLGSRLGWVVGLGCGRFCLARLGRSTCVGVGWVRWMGWVVLGWLM